jgi:hypothetical protein
MASPALPGSAVADFALPTVRTEGKWTLTSFHRKRSRYMKKYSIAILVAAVIALTAGSTVADPVTFTFDGQIGSPYGTTQLENTSDAGRISAYMTNIYGSAVAVTDGRINDNQDGSGDWTGHAWGDNFLRTGDGADMEILFSTTAIGSVSGSGYVFDATSQADWVIIGYGAGYGNVENPNAAAEVARWTVDFGTSTNTYWDWWTWSWVTETIDLGDNSEFDFSLAFGAPVSLLVISDSGTYDVGVDNLVVSSYVVPVPGAVLLGMLGLSVAGARLRKNRVA